MKLTTLFVLSVFALGFSYNFYKYANFLDCFLYEEPYRAFPWQEYNKQQQSESDPLWLIIHLTTAFLNVFFSGLLLITKSRTVQQIQIITHVLFVMIIIPNMHHLGEVNPLYATIINGIPLSIALIASFSSWKNKDLVYFMAITFPIFLEFAVYHLL